MKLLFVFLIAVFSFTFFSQAQDEASSSEKKVRNNYFYVMPFNFIGGIFQLGLQHDFRNSSIIAIPGFSYTSSHHNDANIGFRGELQYRFHIGIPSPKHPKRKQTFYLGPFFSYRYVKADFIDHQYDTLTSSYIDVEKTSKTYAYFGGLIVGLRLLVFKKLTIDAYFGGGMRYVRVKGDDDNYYYYGYFWDRNYSGISPKGGFSVGVAF